VCSGDWSVVLKLDGFTLDRKIHATGWNFFFMAPEVRVMFFGPIGAKKVQNALMRILAKVKRQSFNSLEVTGIVAKRFLGVPYRLGAFTSYPTEPPTGGRKRTAHVSARQQVG
jgi:hypothetical protein